MVLDAIQQICIFSSTTADLYGNLELQQRVAALQLQSKQPLTPALEKIPSNDPEAVNSPMDRLEVSGLPILIILMTHVSRISHRIKDKAKL